jgi:hypothetical protein
MPKIHIDPLSPTPAASGHSARVELSRRNAAARRKLEALQERRRLRMAIADVWNKGSGA